MTKSRRFGTVAIGSLGLALALALTLIGCQNHGPNPGGSDGHRRFPFLGPGGGTGQSPIMVRGGAMSIVSAFPFGTDGSTPCIQAPLNYIAIADAGVYATGVPTGGTIVFSSSTTPPASTWQIDLTGRTRLGAEAPNFSGIRITGTSNCSVAGGQPQSGVDVVLDPAAPNQSSEAFYPYDFGNTPGEDGFYSKRYQNFSLVQTVGGQPYVAAPTKATGDEDISEAMYGVYITQKNTAAPVNNIGQIQSTLSKWRCSGGRCTILIGLNP